MDTKWKKRKCVISFVIFFLGVSLLLGNGITFLQNWAGSIAPPQLLGALKQEDYQASGNFRDYISTCLEMFLDMATDSLKLDGRYSYFYGVADYDGRLWLDKGSAVTSDDTVTEAAPMDWREFSKEEYGYGRGEDNWSGSSDGSGSGSKLTEDERKEIARKTAERYHERIKGDQNLLYAIFYDGSLLYTNSEPLSAGDGMTAPEGCNFLLRCQDGTVQIWKDGEELDIYGDGYYRDGTAGRDASDWYVPGYRNYQVDEEMKKAEVRIAVVQEPLLYTERTYGTSGSRTHDNALYWMRYHSKINQEYLVRCVEGLVAGAALLLLACLFRKSKKEADKGIARFQGRIWAEGKMILFFGILFFGIGQYMKNGGYDLWREVAAYEYEFGTLLRYSAVYGKELLRNLPGWLWVVLFWDIYFVVNDISYNRKIWRQSLAAKLYRTYSDRELKVPLSRRMVHRNAIAFAAAVVCGLLMLLGGVVAAYDGSAAAFWWAGGFILLGMTGFLVTEYLIGAKNVETAREVEVLAARIREIRSGKYESPLRYGEGARAGDNAGTERMKGVDTAGTGRTKDAMDSTGGYETVGTAAMDETVGTMGITGTDRLKGTVGIDGNAGAVYNADTDGAAAYVGRDLEEVMAQLEGIRHGMAKAVEEQMKSQRMKVELIANVSHDIKTPLTSIISYVQFLKEEENLPEHVRDYIAILDEKSQRLKNMVQDVFAVSKAASGELPVHMEELDFGKLLRQTLADMEEQIESSNVSFRTEIPDVPVMIRADGQRLYRVFQNLFQNALQYSLDGSRVYVALKTEGKMAVASVKNTSLMEIERGKDYAERFTRGDASRTDGGSGLGMSIAQSFTEACGGEFRWETDADLFVVMVSFRCM